VRCLIRNARMILPVLVETADLPPVHHSVSVWLAVEHVRIYPAYPWSCIVDTASPALQEMTRAFTAWPSPNREARYIKYPVLVAEIILRRWLQA